jgi:hypothetical protein
MKRCSGSVPPKIALQCLVSACHGSDLANMPASTWSMGRYFNLGQCGMCMGGAKDAQHRSSNISTCAYCLVIMVAEEAGVDVLSHN